MLAIGMVRGKTGIRALEIPMPEIRLPDEVLIRVKEVGLDGTDFNALQHNLQDIAEDRNEIALGHELVGVVEQRGPGVKSLRPGDVVTVTVRRGCNECHPCLHNASDMCLTGRYKERGLHKLDGFLTRFIVDREQYIVKVPPDLVPLGLFIEPISIVEKGIEQIRIIQSRLAWACEHPEHGFLSSRWGACKNALVVGAGPLGILATAVLSLANINVFTSDIFPEDHPKAQLIKYLGATYINARAKSPEEVVAHCRVSGTIDIIFEAAGAPANAIHLIRYMSPGSIFVVTGIPRQEILINLDVAQLARQIVRYNQVIVGSVNSNRGHFEKALRSIGEIKGQHQALFEKMTTHRYKLEDYQQAFGPRDSTHIKTVIEVEPW